MAALGEGVIILGLLCSPRLGPGGIESKSPSDSDSERDEFPEMNLDFSPGF